MLIKFNTDVNLLEFPPTLLQWKIEPIKTGGTENHNLKVLIILKYLYIIINSCQIQHGWYKNLDHVDIKIDITSN